MTGLDTARHVPAPDRRRQHGFTLIELMITVAIVALLASVAYGSFKDAAIKGRRAEGRAALLDLMQQQERYFTQFGSYITFADGATGTNGGSDSSGSAVNIPFRTSSGDVPAKAAYRLGAEYCAAPATTPSRRECVRVYAVPTFSDPAAGNLRFTSTGIKDCTGTNSAVCWR